MRPADLHQSVADSLQADVMRFMAIIAFCLIAILALVRSVAPADPATLPAPAPDTHPARGSGRPAANPDPAPAPATPVRGSGRQAAPTTNPDPARGRAAAPTEPAPAPTEPAPAPTEPAPALAEPAAAATDPATAPAEPAPAPADPAPAPAEPAATAAPEGLSLRFASEQDFLRLVNRGRIQVFAFDGDEVLALAADFSFRPVPAPGQVHELMPETIPALLAGALARRHGDGYRWGVAMPEAMARQIRGFVNDGATGELIIDRFGEVRHRGA